MGEAARQLDLLFDVRGVAGIYGFSSTVFLTNLFTAPNTVPDFFTLPRCVYDGLDELADGGWVVD